MSGNSQQKLSDIPNLSFIALFDKNYYFQNTSPMTKSMMTSQTQELRRFKKLRHQQILKEI